MQIFQLLLPLLLISHVVTNVIPATVLRAFREEITRSWRQRDDDSETPNSQRAASKPPWPHEEGTGVKEDDVGGVGGDDDGDDDDDDDDDDGNGDGWRSTRERVARG